MRHFQPETDKIFWKILAYTKSPPTIQTFRVQNISSCRKKVGNFFVEHKKALTIRTFQGRNARQIRRDFSFLFTMLRNAVCCAAKCPHSLSATQKRKKRHVDSIFSRQKQSPASLPQHVWPETDKLLWGRNQITPRKKLALKNALTYYLTKTRKCTPVPWILLFSIL